MWTHSCHCVYACVCMCRGLGAGLQCLQSVSNGDAAALCRAIDVWVHSCMHANTLHVDGLVRDCDVFSAPAMDMLWSCVDPSTWAFKDQYTCCTLRNHYRRFDILVVAVDTEVIEMTTFSAAGDGSDVRLALFSCMCYGHSAHVIPCHIMASAFDLYQIGDILNWLHEWNWSHVYFDDLVRDCGVSGASAVEMSQSCTDEPSKKIVFIDKKVEWPFRKGCPCRELVSDVSTSNYTVLTPCDNP